MIHMVYDIASAFFILAVLGYVGGLVSALKEMGRGTRK